MKKQLIRFAALAFASSLSWAAYAADFKELRIATEAGYAPVSYTHLTLPTTTPQCRSRWSPSH